MLRFKMAEFKHYDLEQFIKLFSNIPLKENQIELLLSEKNNVMVDALHFLSRHITTIKISAYYYWKLPIIDVVKHYGEIPEGDYTPIDYWE